MGRYPIMHRRGINFLLLASLIFWTTGAALFFHERFEHADRDDDAVALAGPGNTGGNFENSHDSNHRDHHNHDDCPTCQLLAQMQADHGAAPAPICLHERIDCTLHLIDRHPPVIDTQTFAPIRGPPVAV
jgi:hypothetical protein